MLSRSSVLLLSWTDPHEPFQKSLLPTSSSTVRTPSFAIYSRSSSAIKRIKFSTYSGFACETLTKFRILCCNTYRTGIQITYTHHDTAHSYERSGCKSILLGTKTLLQLLRPYHSSAYHLSRCEPCYEVRS